MNAIALTALLVAASAPEPLVWLGATRGESLQSLHTAARRYVHPEGPSLLIVGVAHLGDEAYYDDIEDLLSEADVVVYEAVLSEGARPPGGLDNEARARSTEASLRFLADAMGELDDPPADMKAMADALVSRHRVLANIAGALQNDGWGNSVEIITDASGTRLRSLGADGALGGRDWASDIEVSVPVDAGPAQSLQAELAEALRLRFQLSQLPYEQPHWVLGDMSAEEVSRRLSGGGGTIELGGLLTGSSLSGQMAMGLVRMLPSIDAFSGGRAIDGLRLLMIEMLSNRKLVEEGVSLYGEQLEQVILHDRNDAAVEEVMRQAAARAGDETIGLIYGAAHMKGIDEALQQKGWTPIDTRWLAAISVDLDASNLTADDVDAMREWSKMAGSMFGGQ
ncbi:MAG: hypothetical protein MK101_06320 [Phycisphaerales bacterium]|nr:hypothetical protein [Phycisphaerales bacterium]